MVFSVLPEVVTAVVVALTEVVAFPVAVAVTDVVSAVVLTSSGDSKVGSREVLTGFCSVFTLRDTIPLRQRGMMKAKAHAALGMSLEASLFFERYAFLSLRTA